MKGRIMKKMNFKNVDEVPSKSWQFPKFRVLIAAVLVTCFITGWSVTTFTYGAEATVSLTINSENIVHKVDQKIYGHFLEHIYHSANGGLWGEIVWNRSFEEGLPRPRGRRRGADAQPAAAPVIPEGGTPARHWLLVGQASVSVEEDQPLNSSKSLKLVTEDATAGIAQNNFYLRNSDVCRGSLWIRGNAPEGIRVHFLDGEKLLAEQILPAPSNEWKEYQMVLNPNADAENATLQIISNGKASFWLDQVSLMPDSALATGGFRSDLLQAVADLKPPIIRWPGGIFASSYRWKDGIGPQSKRVVNSRSMWDDLDINSFGTDEFIAMCRKVGAEPDIVINIGPENQRADYIQEACDWIEYCNGPADSTWGKVRAENGHPEPYNVKFWEIDNERWRMGAEVYAQAVNDFVPAMRKKDPSITIMACGSGGLSDTGNGQEWNRIVIEQAAPNMDYISIHHYENPNRFGEGPIESERFYRTLGEIIAALDNKNIRIYNSEWNVQSTDWRTGLYAGGLLNVFERCGDIFEVGGPALFLRHTSARSWDNAFINFDHRTWFPAPNYVVMKFFRDHYAPNYLELTGQTGVLNATATKSDDGKQIFFKVVNPSDSAVSVRLTTEGSFTPSKSDLKLVAPDSLDARNSLDKPDAVNPINGKISVSGGVVEFELPRWSVGVVTLAQ